MSIYDKNNKDIYLKSDIDIARHYYDAFKIDDEIHIVYGLDTDKEIASIQKIDFLLENYDEFIWTPFAQFV